MAHARGAHLHGVGVEGEGQGPHQLVAVHIQRLEVRQVPQGEGDGTLAAVMKKGSEEEARRQI